MKLIDLALFPIALVHVCVERVLRKRKSEPVELMTMTCRVMWVGPAEPAPITYQYRPTEPTPVYDGLRERVEDSAATFLHEHPKLDDPDGFADAMRLWSRMEAEL